MTESQLRREAHALAQEILILDGHIDIPYRLDRKMQDISVRTPDGDFDYPRAREGGLDSAFMAIYIPASYEVKGGARRYADRLIDMVEGFEAQWPEQFVIVNSVSQVRQAFGSGRFAIALGMENGAPIEGNLENLSHFYDRGIRYITLAHSRSNHLSDSSYDGNRRWEGLSPFGREVVREMNRLGMMIDVSHISDEAFDQVIGLSTAPVIASHSSCRHFTPGFERNMSDDMIRRLAENRGVIMINLGSSFISDEFRLRREKVEKTALLIAKEAGLGPNSPEAEALVRAHRRDHPIQFADVKDVADHIDHVVRLVGIDYVGLGSDFDGVGDTLPTGLKDVSEIPNLIFELLRRGYTRDEIEKISSGNVLRVWSEVERLATASFD